MAEMSEYKNFLSSHLCSDNKKIICSENLAYILIYEIVRILENKNFEKNKQTQDAFLDINQILLLFGDGRVVYEREKRPAIEILIILFFGRKLISR